jgi:hypothetical protein
LTWSCSGFCPIALPMGLLSIIALAYIIVILILLFPI